MLMNSIVINYFYDIYIIVVYFFIYVFIYIPWDK